jgi:hypothetical protein
MACDGKWSSHPFYAGISDTDQAIVAKNMTWTSSYVSVETWRRDSASSPWQLIHSAPVVLGETASS